MPESNGARGPDAPIWVSIRAVAWVIDEAKVPPNLLGTLLVIARHADANGRNSHASVPQIAAGAKKSDRQVSRDIVSLKQLGMLIPGDPRVVAHLPAGSRPEVYDLPIGRSGDDVHVTPDAMRGDAHDTPGVTSRAERGVTDDTPGVTPTSPIKAFKDLEETLQPESPSAVVTDEGRKEEAKKIIKSIHPNIVGADLNKLTNAAAAAINRGWPTSKIEEELSKSLGGLDSIIGGLISRMNALDQPPAPPAPPEPKTPCPLSAHRGQPNVYACGRCRAHVLTGENPYQGHEHLRPDDWFDKFPGAAKWRGAWAREITDTQKTEPAPKVERPRTTPTRRNPSHCGKNNCVNGRLVLSRVNSIACPDCAETAPGTPEPLVLGELANTQPEQPRRRRAGQPESAFTKALASAVKTID